MDDNTPPANVNGPAIPQGAAPPPAPVLHIAAAPPVAGAAQPLLAPPARQDRRPRGPVPRAPNVTASGAPPLIELAAALPMHTLQRRTPNAFIPDAQMLFHVLGSCDQLMNSTDRFIRSTPAWIPIVSQLYIAVLWNVMILQLYVQSGYGTHHTDLLQDLLSVISFGECMVPGPLVPFFQALGAIAGPTDWSGDIIPAFPGFDQIWSPENFCPRPSIARILPIPAIMLDQLHYFSTWVIPANQTLYSQFRWYRNVFNADAAQYSKLNRIGPQLCGSLYTSSAQIETARTFWNAALASGVTRNDVTGAQFTTFGHLLGLQHQSGSIQTTWFVHLANIMQKYAQYFNGSVPFKSITPLGLGASAVIGIPRNVTGLSDWLYPPNAQIEPFLSSRFTPRREIPTSLSLQFSHSDKSIEEDAVQFAITTHTNICWDIGIPAANNWTALDENLVRTGSYWRNKKFCRSSGVNLFNQLAPVIASRYHQQAANRAE